MGFDQDDFDLPSARKGQSGGPGGNPPLRPDHAASGPYTAGGYNQSEPWGQGAGFDPPSTPYGSPISGYAPPPPRGSALPATGGGGKRGRAGALIIGILIALLAASTAGYFLFFKDNNNLSPSNIPGPVALATNTVAPTATLKPGQTPLPTKVPTATAQPTAPPGQPTFTPVPTSTPIPYASSAHVTFTAASKSVSSAKPTLVASTGGGDISASQLGSPVSVAVGDTQTAGIDAPQTDFGSQVTFLINVTNKTGVKQNVPQNIQVTSSTKNSSGVFVACGTQNSGATVTPLANNSTTTQTCYEPVESEPAASYYVTVSGWLYQGNSSAGGNPPIWTVPSTCASDNLSAAETAAHTSLLQKLVSATPGGVTVFDRNQYFYNTGGAACTPAANSQQNNPFQFTVSVAGTANETYFSNGAVTSYEQGQLSAAAAAVPPAGSYQLNAAHNSICPGGYGLSGVSSTSVTITCAATGLAGWNWSGGTSTIANLISGESKSAAISSLNAVQGVKSGSATISLTGGSYLPQSASIISFSISTP